MNLSWPVEVLEPTEPITTVDGVKELLNHLANEELDTPGGCPPLLLGLSVNKHLLYAKLDFQKHKVQFHPDLVTQTAQALDKRERMLILALFTPVAFPNGPHQPPRIGGYMTLQEHQQRTEALYTLDNKEFIERRLPQAQLGMPNPFEFLKQRILA